MHISSLWGEYSSGSFGKEAFQFVDFLKQSGFSYWQVLPFVIPDECNSPYKSYSTFGGNPYFVNLDLLFVFGHKACGVLVRSGAPCTGSMEF